jgi:hypothetical protein
LTPQQAVGKKMFLSELAKVFSQKFSEPEVL